MVTVAAFGVTTENSQCPPYLSDILSPKILGFIFTERDFIVVAIVSDLLALKCFEIEFDDKFSKVA